MLKSAITCANIAGLGTWNTASCETVLFSCKVNAATNGCIAKTCVDYTKTDGLSTGSTAVATHDDC